MQKTFQGIKRSEDNYLLEQSIFSLAAQEWILKRFHFCILGIADDEIKLSQLICVYADVCLYLAVHTVMLLVLFSLSGSVQ